MQLTNFDLFGHPVVVPPVSNPPVRRRVVSEEAKRAKLIRHLEQNNNFLLFEELLDFLKAPLLTAARLPKEYASDVGNVAVVEEEDRSKAEIEEARAATIEIPYEPYMEQFQHSVAQLDDRKLRIFGFGEAPVAAKLGYAIREVVVGTEHEIKTQFSGDLIAVKGPSIFGRDGANEWAIMAPAGKNAEESTAERLDYFIADNAATPHIGVLKDGEEDAFVIATWVLPESEDDRDSLELLVIGAVEAANQAPAASLADRLARGATHCATRQAGVMTPIQQMVHDSLIAAAAKSGRKLVSASELATQKGNLGVDSCTTLATLNVDGTDFDLRVCGTGSEAYFEWINDGGDPIGDVFDELGDIEAEKQRFRSIVDRKAPEDHESRFLEKLYSMYDDPDSNVKAGASGFEILDAMAGAIRHRLDQPRKKDEGLTRVEKGFALAARRFAFENLELLSFHSTQAEAEQTMNTSSDARALCVVPATVCFASNGNIRLWQALGEPVANR